MICQNFYVVYHQFYLIIMNVFYNLIILFFISILPGLVIHNFSFLPGNYFVDFYLTTILTFYVVIMIHQSMAFFLSVTKIAFYLSVF